MRVCDSCKTSWADDAPYCPKCGYYSHTEDPSSPVQVPFHYGEEVDEDEELELARAIESQILKQTEEELKACREKLDKARQNLLSLASKCENLTDTTFFYSGGNYELEDALDSAYRLIDEIERLLSP